MNKKEGKNVKKRELEDLKQELLEENALTTMLSDHFNINIEKNGEPNNIELHRYFEEYAILNSMLSKKLADTINNLEKIIAEA